MRMQCVPGSLRRAWDRGYRHPIELFSKILHKIVKTGSVTFTNQRILLCTDFLRPEVTCASCLRRLIISTRANHYKGMFATLVCQQVWLAQWFSSVVCIVTVEGWIPAVCIFLFFFTSLNKFKRLRATAKFLGTKTAVDKSAQLGEEPVDNFFQVNYAQIDRRLLRRKP